jgi:hypothetical protein
MNTYPIQIPHPLVQPWRKNAIHIAEQAVPVPGADLLAQEFQHHAEAAGGADLEDFLFEDWGAADGVEADGDW